MKFRLAVFVFVLIVTVSCSPSILNQTPAEAPTPVVKVSTAVSTLPAATEAPTVEPTAEPTLEAAQLLAYLAPNGNIYLKQLPMGGEQPITSDATGESIVEGVGLVSYQQLSWSSDGLLLAFKREEGTPISEGLQFTNSLQVYNLETGELKTLLENTTVAGFSWQPGTHLIAFAVGVDPNYWSTRAEVNADLAKGIWTVDADSGATAELVKPERGLHLLLPQWSPDGSVLGFEEVEYMEGRGKFAYYTAADGKYFAVEKQVGDYVWTPDGQRLVFDTLTYSATGTERIWISNRDGSEALRISPDIAQSYAFFPTLSPSGEQAAYLVQFGMPDEPNQSEIKLFVQPLEQVEPRDVTRFVEPVYDLAWSPDRASLVLTTGVFEGRVIVQVWLADGAIDLLVRGHSPALQP